MKLFYVIILWILQSFSTLIIYALLINSPVRYGIQKVPFTQLKVPFHDLIKCALFDKCTLPLFKRNNFVYCGKIYLSSLWSHFEQVLLCNKKVILRKLKNSYYLLSYLQFYCYFLIYICIYFDILMLLLNFPEEDNSLVVVPVSWLTTSPSGTQCR